MDKDWKEGYRAKEMDSDALFSQGVPRALNFISKPFTIVSKVV